MAAQTNSLEEVIASYLQALDTGLEPDRQELFERYPELADELRQFFESQDLLDKNLGSFKENPGEQSLGDAAAVPVTFGRRSDAAADRDAGSSNPRDPLSRSGFAPMDFGRYELLEELAQGGMGVVFKARQHSPSRTVALKMILAGRFASSAHIERFCREAEAAAQLDHPHIVPIYEVGQHDGHHYFTMKLVQGSSLADRIDRWLDDKRGAVQTMIAVARGVHYAHQRGILHRDIKPANILIEDRSENSQSRDHAKSSSRSDAAIGALGHPYLTDFGLAKILDVDSELTQSGAMLGTPSYMTPEAASGDPSRITTASDVYGLGSVLFAMLTGEPPIRATTTAETLLLVREQEPARPSSLNRRIDRELDTICLKCLEKDPRDRYGSAEALADDLERWLEHRPIQARSSGAWRHTVKWSRRHPAGAGLIGVIGLAIVAVLAGTLWHNRKLEETLGRVEEQRKAAKQASDRAIEQEGIAKQHQAVAEHREQVARLHLYAAHMNLAHQAWKNGNVKGVLRLLKEHRRQAGQTDVRGFEWYYLWRLCHRGLLHTLRGHTKSAEAAAFSPDGRTLASAGGDGRVRLWNTTTGQEQAVLRRNGKAYCVAFSPDGNTMVSGHGDGTVTVWDFKSRVATGILKKHAKWVSELAFAPDGSRLAAASQDGTVSLWDTATWKLQRMFTDLGPVEAIAFSHDGKRLVAAGHQAEIQVWDVESFELYQVLRGHSTWIYSLAFSPNGALIASGSGAETILWDAVTGDQHKVIEGRTGGVYALAFSSDSKTLVLGGWGGDIQLLNLETNRSRVIGHQDQITSVAISPDGQRLASASLDTTIRIWNLPSVLTDQPTNIRGLVHLALPTNRVAWASPDNAVYVTDLSATHETEPLAVLPKKVAALSLSTDAKWLAVAEQDSGTVQLWDVQRRQLSRAVSFDNVTIGLMRFDPSSNNIAICLRNRGAASGTGSLVLLSVPEWQEIRSLPVLAENVVFSSGEPIATLEAEGRIKVWEMATGKKLMSTRVPPGRKYIRLSPDGRLLAAAASDNAISLTETETGKQRHSLSIQWPLRMEFTRDGTEVAAVGGDGSVKLWDVTTGAERTSMQGHIRCARMLSLSPDERILATCSDDRTVKLWDMATGQERLRLHHNSDVYFVGFTGSGDRLISASAGGAMRIWHAANASDVSSHRIIDERLQRVRNLRAEAWTHRSEGRYEEAKQDYLAAAELRPQDSYFLNALAQFLASCPSEDHRDIPRALEIASRAVALAPHEGRYWHTLGVAHYRNDDYASAIAALEKSLLLRFGEFESRNTFFLAMANWRLGNHTKAREWQLRAVTWMLKNAPFDRELLGLVTETTQTMVPAEK